MSDNKNHFDDYQERAVSTAVYPGRYAVIYPALGLAGEAGEIANKVKKVVRGDRGAFDREAMKAELGDVLWYLAVIAEDLSIPLSEIAEANLAKLQGRASRGTLKGDGDNR